MQNIPWEMQIIQEMNKTKIIVPNWTASMIIHTKVLKLIIEEKIQYKNFVNLQKLEVKNSPVNIVNV